MVCEANAFMICEAIPVERPQDVAFVGKGKIYLNLEEPQILRGIDTEFTKQLHARDILSFCGASVEVAEVISDTLVKIKKPLETEAVIASLTSLDPTDNTTPVGVGYKIMPHLDQSGMFHAVVERLHKGECVGIFPEGGSHDRTEFLPLKAGVAIMALSAMDQHPGLDVKIVPVGLNYFNADKFRSRAVIEYGDVISIPPEMIDRYKKGGAEKRGAVAFLLDTIYTNLKAITVTTPDYETLMVVQAARRLYKPDNRKLDLDKNLILARKFAEGYEKFKDVPEIVELKRNVLRYNLLLKYYGIRDHQVDKTHVDRTYALRKLLKRGFELLFIAFLGLPGFTLTFPIAFTAKRIANAKMKGMASSLVFLGFLDGFSNGRMFDAEAKATSSVKIEGRDVVATWKVLTTVFLVPVFWTFYTFCSFLIAFFAYGFTAKQSFHICLVVSAILPFLTWATIRCYDHGIDVLKSFRPLTMTLVSKSSAQQLRDLRQELRASVVHVVEELGPKAFGPDFQKDRIFKEATDYASVVARKMARSETIRADAVKYDNFSDSDFDDNIGPFKVPKEMLNKKGEKEKDSEAKAALVVPPTPITPTTPTPPVAQGCYSASCRAGGECYSFSCPRRRALSKIAILVGEDQDHHPALPTSAHVVDRLFAASDSSIRTPSLRSVSSVSSVSSSIKREIRKHQALDDITREMEGVATPVLTSFDHDTPDWERVPTPDVAGSYKIGGGSVDANSYAAGYVAGLNAGLRHRAPGVGAAPPSPVTPGEGSEPATPKGLSRLRVGV
ncbi:hypothetical protein HK104_000375 [Borealophlyctis nickersoniae]|nr:hypothetical protein HK104_000375 [Borealophlyctis nickersoniae]